jgi:dipeptidase E
MKLFLSSYQIGNDPDAFVELVGSNKNVALIMNATDPFGDERRPQYVAKYTAEFSELGLCMEELDLRNFYGSQENLKKSLDRFGTIWVSGGNTFALRWAMNRSGLDKLLPHRLHMGDLIYGGFSAGACVLSPTLKGIHLTDEPEKVAKSELQWDGLGLIDFCIAPHYRSNHPESPAIEKVVEYFRTHNLKYRTLHDGEALRLVGTSIEKVGHPNPTS